MATLPYRTLQPTVGRGAMSPILGQGGGRADVILGLLGAGGTASQPPYNGGNPPTLGGGRVPNRYLPGGGGASASSAIGAGPFHLNSPPSFQDTLHSGGRFMDMLGGINQHQLNLMQHGMAPGGFGGDFSHVSPAFIERLAHMLRPQGPEGTPGAGMFRLPKSGNQRPASFRQALIQRAMNQ